MANSFKIWVLRAEIKNDYYLVFQILNLNLLSKIKINEKKKMPVTKR